MLVICNGAIKSGSTWLYNILVQLTQPRHPPARYLTGRSERSPCIWPHKFEQFLANEDFRGENYITKNHLASDEHRQMLLRTEDVYLFDIERDPRDVVVSNFYHDRFRNGYEGSFEQYYWERGREVAASLSRYHALWRDAGPRSYVSSYEELHRDFASEVARIAGVMRLQPSPEEIEGIREKTTIGSLRAKYQDDPRYQGEKFFRKGEIGDWQNHFEGRLLRDVEKVMHEGIGPLDLPALRNRVRRKVSGWLGR